MPNKQPAIRLRNAMVRHLSADEIHDLLWELGLDSSVALSGLSKATIATRAADAMLRHGMIDAAIAILKIQRPDIPIERLSRPDGIAIPQPLTLATAMTRFRAVSELVGKLDLSTIDARKNILFYLEIPESELDMDGSGTQFANRLLRYVHPKQDKLLMLLELLNQAESEDTNGEQE